ARARRRRDHRHLAAARLAGDPGLLPGRQCRGQLQPGALRRRALRRARRGADADRDLLPHARPVRRRSEAADHDRHVRVERRVLRRLLPEGPESAGAHPTGLRRGLRPRRSRRGADDADGGVQARRAHRGSAADVFVGRVHGGGQPCRPAGDQRAGWTVEGTVAGGIAADGAAVRRGRAGARGRGAGAAAAYATAGRRLDLARNQTSATTASRGSSGSAKARASTPITSRPTTATIGPTISISRPITRNLTSSSGSSTSRRIILSTKASVMTVAATKTPVKARKPSASTAPIESAPTPIYEGWAGKFRLRDCRPCRRSRWAACIERPGAGPPPSPGVRACAAPPRDVRRGAARRAATAWRAARRRQRTESGS